MDWLGYSGYIAPLTARLAAVGTHKNAAKGGEEIGPFSFSNTALAEALTRIYYGGTDARTDIDAGLFNEVLRILDDATDEGFSQSAGQGKDLLTGFSKMVDRGNAVFSAFKVHRMQNDIATQLYDSNGVLKPFEQWKKDVHPLLDHHVQHWLRTEYDTAVIRAQQAADWQRFEQYADLLPNLEWMPSTSAHPGADHKVYWGTILPINHPFWKAHRPGDRWNCKCSLSATDAPATAPPAANSEPQNQPAPGLDNNPGVDGRLFSDTHPYIAHAYDGAREAVEKFLAERVEKEKPIKVEVKKEEIKAASKKAYEWVSGNIPEKGYTLPATPEKKTFELKVSRGALKDVIDHFKTPEDKITVSGLVETMGERIYTHSADLGEGKKGDPEKVKRNLEKKRRRGVISYNYYDITINGETWELNCEVFKEDYEKPYALRRKKR